MLRVTPIAGCRWQPSAPQGTSTLVEYGGVKVLVNVGNARQIDDQDMMVENGKDNQNDATYKHTDAGGDVDVDGDVSMGNNSTTVHDTATSTPTAATWPDHDVLVISDSTVESIGGLPQYCEKFPSTTILATFPTVKMGQMVLWDLHAQLSFDGMVPPFSLQQVDNAMSRLRTIKYSQTIHVPKGLAITAQRAGHVVGGAFWILKRLKDETSVVITSTFSIAKEYHLDSSTLLRYGATPDVLVTRPGGPALPLAHDLIKPKTVSQTQKQLLESIMSVLRRDGNVLLPVDASGRVLELLLLLHQHWEKQRLAGTYHLVWLGPMVGNTLEFARSQLEWMHDRLGTQFLDKHGNPFALPQVTMCTHVDQLSQLSGNMCVLASGLSLDHGPARDLLLQWADNDNHAILFTDTAQCWERDLSQLTSSENMPEVEDAETTDANNMTQETGRLLSKSQTNKYTAAFQLLQYWCNAERQGSEMDDSVDVDVFVPRRAPLVGQELNHFLQQEEQARQRQRQQAQEQQMLQQVELAKGRLRLAEDENEKPINPNLKYMNTKQTRLDSSLFLKFSKPIHLTFDATEHNMGIGQPDTTALETNEIEEDDYGIAIEPEHFKDIVTGVDPNKFSTGRVGDDVIRRGFGFGSGNESNVSKKRKALDDLEEEDVDERGLEAMDLSEGRGIIRGRSGRPPTKVTTEPRRIQVFCEIDYIPLEGRVNARATRQSIRALQPRQVVVLGGSKPATYAQSNEKDEERIDPVQSLASAAQGLSTTSSKVKCPSNNETVELNVGHAAYSVRLIANPFRTAEERAKEEEQPEPIELEEAKLGSCTVALVDYVATGQKVALDGSIVLAPRSNTGNTLSLYLSDGEVLLTNLRTDMIAQGMKAEYTTHSGYTQLVVNGKVIVKKDMDSGRINVEGPLCEDFFTVRAVVSGQYVTL